ncbi:HAD family hydrolase [Morganella morganii]|nr:HAD family hydrolase [Morganella morganii]MCU6213105.1 HAD-IB family hydrolase [Morganella morganii]MCU6225271.1 HAD-IB family hydrolase [Morganella morganii]MCU6235087.1 HAD-IB family hydrolase [Morganella morganii]MCU6238909.1 HAD-IB family hydrolase [Morganella morganii]MCU6275967.1 HAD-IB family hydrolase [Morganella morganii]
MSTLAVFDLDHTLIAADSSLLWTDYLWEKGIITDPAFLAADKQMMADYSAGKLDMAAYMAFSLKALGNATVAQIDEWVAEFTESKVRPLVYPDALKTLAFYKEHGVPVIIISATADFIVKPVAKMLGVNLAFGIELEVRNDHYTGALQGITTFREGKVEKLANFLDIRQFLPERTIFYTDSANDLPLCRYATDVLTVNADPVLQAEAEKQGWMQLTWSLNPING